MASTPEENRGECFALRGVELEFGNLAVLDKVDFSLHSHEIHALVGEHGAGKSSIAKIIAGFQEVGGGRLLADGEPLKHYTPRAAKDLGIEIVTQNNPLFDEFTVANNIMIDKASMLLRHFNRKRTVGLVAEFLGGYGIDIDPTTLARDLNLSDRVMVDLLKHIYHRPRILILDETLEQLSNKSLQRVIPILKNFKEMGSCILFITHRVDDIYEIADKVSVIREGRILVTEDVRDIDKINLIKLAYTQVIREHSIKHVDPEFYQLLKYNEAILTHLPFSLMVMDTQRKVRLVNDAARKLFPQKEPSHLQTSLRAFLGARNEELYGLLKDRIAAKKEDYLFNVQVRSAEGVSNENICVLPLFDGKLHIGHIITMEDVTDYERLRRQLSLSENLSSIGLLAAGVAHEINNPLEIINYYVQNLRLTNPGNESIQEIVRDVEEEIETISSIIENLLIFSDSKKPEREEVELNSLIRGILLLLRKTTENRRIALSFAPSCENLVVHAAKTELRQVFLNILKNSIEAIRDEGSIVVTTATEVGESGEGRAMIRFADSGPGMDQHIINNLYQPFFTTKLTPSLNMGLGLSISYNIVTRHGGSMAMRNGDAGGCETTIRLALLERPPPT